MSDPVRIQAMCDLLIALSLSTGSADTEADVIEEARWQIAEKDAELEKLLVLLRDIRFMHRCSFDSRTWERIEELLGPLTVSTEF